MGNLFKKGITLVEVIVGTAIISVVLVSVFTSYVVFLKTALADVNRIQSSMLLEEGVEAVRFLRDSGWTTKIVPLSLNTNYYLRFNGVAWTVSASPVAMIDGIYDRKFTLSSVSRDNSTQDIVASGASGSGIDNSTKKLTVFVSWRDGSATTTKSIVTYLTNLFDN